MLESEFGDNPLALIGNIKFIKLHYIQLKYRIKFLLNTFHLEAGLKVDYCRYENLKMFSSSHKDLPKVLHSNTVYFLRYTHRYL